MKELGIVTGLILFLGLFGYGAYKYVYPTISWNQKMTVVLDVDGTEVSGSSVSRVTVVFQPAWLPEMLPAELRFHAEAVDVAIPGEKHLFALLRSKQFNSFSYMLILPHRIFHDVDFDRHGGPRSGLDHAISRIRDERAVPPDLFPVFVVFSDLNDPSSVQIVNPDEFSTKIGGGISLKSVTFSITDQRAKEHLQEELPWLVNLRRGALIPHPSSPPLSLDPTHEVSTRDFLSIDHWRK